MPSEIGITLETLVQFFISILDICFFLPFRCSNLQKINTIEDDTPVENDDAPETKGKEKRMTRTTCALVLLPIRKRDRNCARTHRMLDIFIYSRFAFLRTLANSHSHLNYYYYSVCAAKAQSQTRPRLSKVNVENRIVLAYLCARQQFFPVCGECCRRSALSNKMVRWIDALAFGLNVKQVVTSWTRRNCVSLRFAASDAIRILLVVFDVF